MIYYPDGRAACPLAALLLASWLLPALSQQTGTAYSLSSSSSSSSSSSGPTTSIISQTTIRLRANRLRRPELCRDSLPRKAEDLPELVISGRVKEVYIKPLNPVDETTRMNMALVNVGRVFKGNQQLEGTDIMIAGFNSSDASPCPNYVKPNDTLLLLLQRDRLDPQAIYSIQGASLLSMNLANLDRLNALAADEPYKRRSAIEDILCEKHYCPYGRCVVNERNQTSCQCPELCSGQEAPVCGSDNVTYSTECHLIREGCNRRKPMFVTKESAC